MLDPERCNCFALLARCVLFNGTGRANLELLPPVLESCPQTCQPASIDDAYGRDRSRALWGEVMGKIDGEESVNSVETF